jgi:hypothetical protein
MLPSRGIENLASSVMNYARTSSGRRTIGGGMAAAGTAGALYSYSRNPNRMGPGMAASGAGAVAGYSMLASKMKF